MAMLHEFVTMYRDEIIKECRAKVAIRSIPPPTTAEIDHGVPMFLDELVEELRKGSGSPAMATTARKHGRDLQRQGFSVSQVVHDYGDICQAITGLAVEKHIPIATDEFRLLNRCLDDAIANAVTEFVDEGEQRPLSRELSTPAAALTLQLHTLSTTALVALAVIKEGKVGISGSTGAVLERALTQIATLVDQARSNGRMIQ
jgi:hypothetical protein